MQKTHKKGGKSLAKSYGLKAVFAKDEKVLIAIAGKKNETILEQGISKDNYRKDIYVNPPKFDANIKEEKKVSLKPEKYNETVVNNPYYVKEGQVVGQDYLGIKDKLEETFFGKTFNDNIHIQIAYKLLDIRKILGMSVGNAVFSLNNLQYRPVGEAPKDTVGTIQVSNSINEIESNFAKEDKDFIDVLLDYTRYFDNVFEKNDVTVDNEVSEKIEKLNINQTIDIDTIGKVKKIVSNDRGTFTNLSIGNNTIRFNGRQTDFKNGAKFRIKGIIKRNEDRYNEKKEEWYKSYSILSGASFAKTEVKYNPDTYSFNYDILRLVSYLRQATVHSVADNKDEYIDWIYSIDKKEELDEILSAADKVFSKQLEIFNKDFNANAQKNLYMICLVLNNNPMSMFDDEIKEIYDKYYQFVLFKENRNVGINLRNIRNNIYDEMIKPYHNERTLSRERSKINTLLDYFIFQDFSKNEKVNEEAISKLQANRKEEGKELIYKDLTKEFIKRNPNLVDRIVKVVSDTIEKKDINFIPESCKPSKTIKVSSFAKYIYVLTKFLDTKETNNLLTSLINSFDNIGSLIKVLRDENGYKIFKDRFYLLNEMSPFDLANEFMLVKNLATMKTKIAKANVNDDKIKVCKRLYCSAINLFNDRNNEMDITDAEFESIMDDFSSNTKTRDKKLKKKGTSGSKVRNFLINNVINSRRFYFIIKYYDTRRCREIIQNERLVRFILERDEMPFDQLKSYYKSITNNDSNDKKLIVDTLVSRLQKISFNSLLNKGKRLKEIGNNQYNAEVVELRTLIGLYLTICYLIVKGIVNVNSIYLLAWSAYERDMYYLYNENVENNNHDFLKAPDDFYKKKKCYEERHKYLKYDIAEAKDTIDRSVYKKYRNKVVHYNICTGFMDYVDGIGRVKSYFDIYNFCVQRFFAKENKDTALKAFLDENHYFKKDYLKLINMPFAYNMARYKNLTIADLFNDKYPSEKLDNKEDNN